MLLGRAADEQLPLPKLVAAGQDLAELIVGLRGDAVSLVYHETYHADGPDFNNAYRTFSFDMARGTRLQLVDLVKPGLDPLVAIPLHGVVQLVSNSSRSAMHIRHLSWPIVTRYSLLLLGDYLSYSLSLDSTPDATRVAMPLVSAGNSGISSSQPAGSSPRSLGWSSCARSG